MMPSSDSSHQRLARWARRLIGDARGEQQPRTRKVNVGKVVWQTSTMEALLAGIYDSDVTIRQVLRHGDFGLGTFDGLDGELIILDGFCYRIRSDGGAEPADDRDHSPFAVVTTFTPDITFDITEPLSLTAVRTLVDEAVPSTNLVTAVRLHDTFTIMTTRSVAKQHEPYPGLAAAAAAAPKHTEEHVEGTVVGFRTPDFEEGLSVAGYHLHFIDSARAHGGHVFEFTLARGAVALSISSEVHLSLPRSGAFLSTELVHPEEADDIRNAEG